MRGARVEGGRGESNVGLIPARAGSTSGRDSSSGEERAHPRPCGEHAEGVASRFAVAGSSPPVRGARRSRNRGRRTAGLIPARAGSTGAVPSPTCGHWAHPRPCGEHAAFHQTLPLGLGSSPPVRGALLGLLIAVGVVGLIPARAGSTSKTHTPRFGTWAHPRPCGEHAGAKSPSRLPPGSSPPVRGAHAAEQ